MRGFRMSWSFCMMCKTLIPTQELLLRIKKNFAYVAVALSQSRVLKFYCISKRGGGNFRVLVAVSVPRPNFVIGPVGRCAFLFTADSPRLLCWILADPHLLETRVRHQMATWGGRCHKLLVLSSRQNDSFPAVGLNVTEGRDHIASKVRPDI